MYWKTPGMGTSCKGEGTSCKSEEWEFFILGVLWFFSSLNMRMCEGLCGLESLARSLTLLWVGVRLALSLQDTSHTVQLGFPSKKLASSHFLLQDRAINTCPLPTQVPAGGYTYPFSTSSMVLGRGWFLVSGRQKTSSPERMGNTPYMIQGRWGEYTIRVIRSGARTAPILANTLLIPETVDLCVQITIQGKSVQVWTHIYHLHYKEQFGRAIQLASSDLKSDIYYLAVLRQIQNFNLLLLW